jgi:cobalt/nickel transport system ATP-binding protein
MEQKQPIINLEGIHYSYPGTPPILKDLELTIFKGDRIGLVAPNGSGKTTLFHIIMGLLKPSAGRVNILGKDRRTEQDFKDVRRRIGLLFQDADDQLFSPTVLEDVAFGPLNLGKSKEEAISISKKTLEFLGLDDFEDRITYKLSGGEKRLVSLATVLAMEPEVLLLDEPGNALDSGMRSRLIDVLNHLSITLMLISHEFDFIAETTERIFSMEHGRLLQDDEVYIHTHQHSHKVGRQPHEH